MASWSTMHEKPCNSQVTKKKVWRYPRRPFTLPKIKKCSYLSDKGNRTGNKETNWRKVQRTEAASKICRKQRHARTVGYDVDSAEAEIKIQLYRRPIHFKSRRLSPLSQVLEICKTFWSIGLAILVHHDSDRHPNSGLTRTQQAPGIHWQASSSCG